MVCSSSSNVTRLPPTDGRWRGRCTKTRCRCAQDDPTPAGCPADVRSSRINGDAARRDVRMPRRRLERSGPIRDAWYGLLQGVDDDAGRSRRRPGPPDEALRPPHRMRRLAGRSNSDPGPVRLRTSSSTGGWAVTQHARCGGYWGTSALQRQPFVRRARPARRGRGRPAFRGAVRGRAEASRVHS